LYNRGECDTIGGNYYDNGECLKRGGGSYSWDCRGLNAMNTVNPARSYKYFERTNDFMLTINQNNIYPYSINPAVFTNAPGQQMPYPAGQWFHVALVWDDAFNGYNMFINGNAGPHQSCPAFDMKLMLEQIRIGCDNHPEGQSWAGGIAWFRAFDYRLSTELITRDMNDDWETLE
jgi:hypothetical protein